MYMSWMLCLNDHEYGAETFYDAWYLKEIVNGGVIKHNETPAKHTNWEAITKPCIVVRTQVLYEAIDDVTLEESQYTELKSYMRDRWCINLRKNGKEVILYESYTAFVHMKNKITEILDDDGVYADTAILWYNPESEYNSPEYAF